MTNVRPPESGSASAAGTVGDAHPAPHNGRGRGLALVLLSPASNQAGASLGALAFPVMGPVGVVAVRQILAAIVLIPVVRPRVRGLRSDQWWPIVGLAVVLCVMNLSLYAAIERIGLGLAVTLEFLGPLAVAIAGSRRLVTIICPLLAGIGVVLLTRPGASADLFGIALALLAAVAWGAYILLNRCLGQRLPGLQGTATASLLTTAVWIPVAAIWFTLNPPTPGAVLLALACGVLSSLVPYVADLLALRRVPVAMFGTFTSINPVFAAMFGWLVLQQALGIDQWIGIALIAASNVVVSLGSNGETRSAGPVGRAKGSETGKADCSVPGR